MRMIAAAFAAITVLAGACAPITPPVEPGAPKRCDAANAQSLIGKHVGAVDYAAGANVRIVCTTCATTRDYRPDRLIIRFDEATGIIKTVDCG
jgi:hypothetical protein